MYLSIHYNGVIQLIQIDYNGSGITLQDYDKNLNQQQSKIRARGRWFKLKKFFNKFRRRKNQNSITSNPDVIGYNVINELPTKDELYDDIYTSTTAEIKCKFRCISLCV